MAVYSAEAVVLRKVDYSEADRVLTLFTLERGKIPAIAKGVRRAKARMSGQLDVFAHGRMMLAEGRNMDVITQFQRLSSTRGVGEDVGRAAVASVVAEVADKVLEERHPQPELYRIVVAALAALGQGATPPLVELSLFLGGTLVELGYAPELTVCARCGGSLGAAPSLGFSAIAGGVVCGHCVESMGTARPISQRTIKVIRVCVAGERDLFLKLRLDDEDLRAAEETLAGQLEHHLDRRLKSIDFVRRVAFNPAPARPPGDTPGSQHRGGEPVE